MKKIINLLIVAFIVSVFFIVCYQFKCFVVSYNNFFSKTYRNSIVK